jgi:hypothetical protein
MWSNLILGLWLMISPFVLAILNRQAFQLLWEDLLLGFGIATFSLCRLLSRNSEQIAVADWLITALAVITLTNPILYSYYGIRAAAWNNSRAAYRSFSTVLKMSNWNHCSGFPGRWRGRIMRVCGSL